MHGVYDGEVSHDGENLIVDGTKIKVRRQEEKKKLSFKKKSGKGSPADADEGGRTPPGSGFASTLVALFALPPPRTMLCTSRFDAPFAFPVLQWTITTSPPLVL